MKTLKIIVCATLFCVPCEQLYASRPAIKTAAKVVTLTGSTVGVTSGLKTNISNAESKKGAVQTSPKSFTNTTYTPFVYEHYTQLPPNTSRDSIALTTNRPVSTKTITPKSTAVSIKKLTTVQDEPVTRVQVTPDVSPLNESASKPFQAPNLQFITAPQAKLSTGPLGSFTITTKKPLQTKPVTGQLLLTYDDNYVQEHIPTLTQLTEKIEPQTPEKPIQIINETIKKTPAQAKPPVVIKTPTPSKNQPTKAYDVDQINIETMVEATSGIIDSFKNETTSNMYVQANLEQNIIDAMFPKNSQGTLESINLANEAKIVEKLAQKYKNNPDIQYVLKNVTTKIQKQASLQAPVAMQAQSTISFYLGKNPESLTSVASFMNFTPEFDSSTGNVINLPSIEKIIETAVQSPSAQGYKALEAILQSSQTAGYASRQGSAELTSQLTAMQNKITSALQNKNFNKFQSWGTYLSSFIPSTRDVLNAPIIKNVTISQAVNLAQDTATAATPYTKSIASVAGFTNVGDMTLSQAAKKVGLTPADAPVEPTPPKPGSLQANINSMRNELKAGQDALNFDMSTQDIQTIVAKNSSNKAISQSYTPGMLNDIFTVIGKKPQINSKTGAIENMPTVDTIMQMALDKPSQESFNAAQSALEATKIALYTKKGESSMLATTPNYKQLKQFETQLTSLLKDPKLAQFHPLTTQVTSYVTSLLPSTQTILDTTGLGNVTVNQAITTISQSPRVAQQVVSGLGLKPITDLASLAVEGAVIASGVPNMTLAQAYDYVNPPVKNSYNS